jgi:hypothetical protein
MPRAPFPGSFFLHPAFLAAMGATLANNLWFKGTGLAPFWAGKITDAAIMVFLPALICLGVGTVRFAFAGGAAAGDDECRPSRAVVLAAIAVSAAAMIAIKASDAGAAAYTTVIRAANAALVPGRVTARAVADPTDLATLAFLVVPYMILITPGRKRRPKEAR